MQRIAISLWLACEIVIVHPASADVIIPYNEYSASPTIGRGNSTSTDPKNPGNQTDAEKDFATICHVWSTYAENIGKSRLEPGLFPAKSGLPVGKSFNLVRRIDSRPLRIAPSSIPIMSAPGRPLPDAVIPQFPGQRPFAPSVTGPL